MTFTQIYIMIGIAYVLSRMVMWKSITSKKGFKSLMEEYRDSLKSIPNEITPMLSFIAAIITIGSVVFYVMAWPYMVYKRIKRFRS